MPPFLFYFFAFITLAFGLAVVLARNPVASAMALVVSFAGLAALFISLDAYFIGIVQILVYAGAVMVLFLFIIMLLDIKAEEIKEAHTTTVIGTIALAAIFSLQIATVLSGNEAGKKSLAQLPLDMTKAAATQKLPTIIDDLKEGTLPDTKLMGQTLFTEYPFHLQAIGLLLLAGTVGVVVLSRRDKAAS
jgi:NADH-quinone oxidoreductase subunit J